ncbi:MAG: zinc-binding dehydrogenase, partial [Actinomycetota bacterium]
RPDIAFFSSEDIRTDVETHLLAAVLQGVAQGRFDPGIDAVVGLDDVAEAHRNMEANAYAGKVVVDLSR